MPLVIKNKRAFCSAKIMLPYILSRLSFGLIREMQAQISRFAIDYRLRLAIVAPVGED